MEGAIAFVPARCGSKSIPLKNIRDFCGKPLLWWVLSALQEARSIGEVFVATDCDEIAGAVQGLGLSKVRVYRRNPENASDTSSTESVMLEFLEAVPQPPERPFFLVQATSPFTTAGQLDTAYGLFTSSGSDSLLTVSRMKRFFWSPDGVSLNYDYRQRPRRQDFDGQLVENGAFYISTVGAIAHSKNRLSGRIAVFEIEDERALYELDEETDWVICETLMKAGAK